MKFLICITELNYISKYINYVLYIHITYDMRRVKTPHKTTTEHLNITNQILIDGSSSLCSAKCTNVAYISASVNIVKISILLCLGKGIPPGTGCTLLRSMLSRFLNFMLQLWERTCAAGNWTNHSNWFMNRFTGLPTALIKPLNSIYSK